MRSRKSWANALSGPSRGLTKTMREFDWWRRALMRSMPRGMVDWRRREWCYEIGAKSTVSSRSHPQVRTCHKVLTKMLFNDC